MDGTATLLRQAGLRVTKPRIAVYEALERLPHSDVETLCARARTVLPTVSTQAVYDVLRVLTDAGLVRRIAPVGSASRYETRTGDNHHHLVCRTCGRVEDVDCAVGRAPCLEAADDMGYAVDEADVVYWGTCPSCAAAGG